MSDTPENVAVSVGCDTTSLTITWDEPGAFAWTEVFTEIERTSCEGTWTVAVIEGSAGSWCDQTIPLSYPEVCAEDNPCEITYRLRYTGLNSGAPVVGDWTVATDPESVTGVSGTSYLYADGVTLARCPDESWGKTRPAQVFTPSEGGIPTVTTGSPGGREYTLGVGSVGRTARDALADLLANRYVHYRSPYRTGGWFAPHDERVELIANPRVWLTTVVLTEAPVQVQYA